MPRQAAAEPQADEVETQATPDAFEAAAQDYHDCVGEVIRGYEEALERLNDEYIRAVEEAATHRTPLAQQKALAEANERYANGLAENVDSADKAVEACLRQFVGALKAALGDADDDALDASKLTSIAADTLFIANAASGAFPAVWWRPVRTD
jgi:sugar-specific transcriptional regulator TrmB